MRRIAWTMLSVATVVFAEPTRAAPCVWRAGEVFTLVGTVTSGGLNGSLLRRVESGSGRLYERTDFGIVASAKGYDGRLAWSQDVSGAAHDLDSDFARRLATSEAWLDARQGCAPTASGDVTKLAPQSDEGKRFDVWRITPPGGAAFEAWYDAASGRLDRAFFQTAETRLIRHFSDWREIGRGRWVAFAQRDEFPEDQETTSYQIVSAHITTRAGIADFKRPQPPHDVRMREGRAETTVPFEDDHRTRVYLPVYLNGKGPFTFELDNGAHFIVSHETAKAVGLAAQGAFNSTGAGNDVVQSGFARVASVRIGEAEMLDQPVRVRTLSPAANDRGLAPPRAGILGLELFERFVVQIDHRNRTVSLRPFAGTRPPARGVPLRLVFAEDAPLVRGSYNGVVGDFMLDIGNAGPTIIEDFWATAHDLTSVLKQGVAFPTATLSIGEIGIGSFKLAGEAVNYYGPAERGSEYTRAVAGIYGQPLLSRFNTTYDYQRKTVWLDLLPEMTAIPANRTGLLVTRRTMPGPLVVAAVAERSPAAEAGLKANDTLLTIGGRATRDMSRADAQAALLQPAGTVVELTVGDTDAPRTIRLTLRDLVSPR